MTIESTIATKDGNAAYIERILNLPPLLDKKSHFLFGPRQTGKTSLIHHTMKEVKVYDLLDTSIFLDLSQNPGRIAQEATRLTRPSLIRCSIVRVSSMAATPSRSP